MSGALETVRPRLFRLVRNPPMEKWARGAPQPYAPLFDVEEVDHWRLPLAVVATGIGAEDARAVIAALGGAELAPSEFRR